MSLSVTTEFRHEYEQERSIWLRRRFLWYTGVIIVFTVLGLLLSALLLTFAINTVQQWMNIVLSVISGLLYVLAFLAAWRTVMKREKLLRLVSLLIVASGALGIVGTPIILEFTRYELRDQILARAERLETVSDPEAMIETLMDSAVDGEPDGSIAQDTVVEAIPEEPQPPVVTDRQVSETVARIVVLGNGFGGIFMWHFIACLFLPWTARESFKPILPLLILNALVTLFYIRFVPVLGTVTVLASPLVAAPGMAVCWWRTSRFRRSFAYRMLYGRYGEMRQELATARSIHDALFPQPIEDGPVRFTYLYEPMRQIGGDFLYARSIKSGTDAHPILNVVLLDVTGHGISAALTVNRLAGEIDREFGKRPETSPGELLKGLNDYLHHSLARHSVYASALCVQVNPNRDILRWASAGHPPAFVRTVDGRVDRLNSTAFLLGVCRVEDFVSGEESMRFGPGDALLAYTDGATEATNSEGRMLRIDGLQRIVVHAADETAGRVSSPGEWSRRIIEEVDRYRGGPTQDDLLVAQIWRPISG